MTKCAECGSAIKNHKWARINAQGKGWLFLKDGTAYCPKHIPPYLKEWRERKNG